MSICQFKFAKRIVVVALLGLLLGLVAGCGPYSPFLWLKAKPVEIQVLVPEQFEGQVLLAWQIPDGAEPQQQGEVLIYRVQNDGVLLLRSDPPNMGDWRFFYELRDGTLQAIPRSPCFHDSKEQGIVVCTGMMAGVHNTFALRPNQEFFVTTAEDFRTGRWTGGEEYFRKYDEYLDRLMLPDEP